MHASSKTLIALALVLAWTASAQAGEFRTAVGRPLAGQAFMNARRLELFQKLEQMDGAQVAQGKSKRLPSAMAETNRVPAGEESAVSGRAN